MSHPDPDTTTLIEPFLGRLRTAAPLRRRVGGGRLVPGRPGSSARALVAAWQDAVAERRPHVVVVGGGAGVGKTRLVTDVARDLARRGAVTATSTCFATAGRVPLAPVADWLRTPELTAARASLDSVWRRRWPACFRTLDLAAPSQTERRRFDPWQRHRFFEGLSRRCSSPRSRSCWCSTTRSCATRNHSTLLSLLLKLGDGHRLLVLLTVRHEAGDHDRPVDGWSKHMSSAGRATLMYLDPLDLDGTTQLAARVGQPLDEEGAAALQSATGGFPLYALEALRTGFDPAATPSRKLAGVLRRRLRQGSPAASGDRRPRLCRGP